MNNIKSYINKKRNHIELYIQNLTPEPDRNSYVLMININFRKYSYIIKNNKLFVDDFEDVNIDEGIILNNTDYNRWLQFESLLKINVLFQLKTRLIFHVEYNHFRKICNKIYEYFILGKMNGLDIKTFTHKYNSTKN